MYANNRAGKAPAARFRTAGGSLYTYAHPFLTGQLLGAGVAIPSADEALVGSINEVNISRSLRLNDTFFNATPAQANALQEVMVDGSTITITNHLMNGSATLTVLPGTGLVRDGDLTAIAPFIASSKDNIGGVLCRRRFTSAGALTRIYYGVSWANFPHDVDAGNAVPTYSMTMLYAGWIEGLKIGTGITSKVLWAVGNQHGLEGNFVPFQINGIGRVDQGGEYNQGNADIDGTTAATNADVAIPGNQPVISPNPGFGIGNLSDSSGAEQRVGNELIPGWGQQA